MSGAAALSREQSPPDQSPPDQSPPDNLPRERSRRPGLPSALVLYLALALVWWWPVVTHLRSRAVIHGTGDAGLFIWWIQWAEFAVAHGHDPLVSSYLQAPLGASAVWNTSVLSAGLLLSPLTAAFGPIVSFNLLLILAPPMTAWAAFWWLRRHVSAPAAVLGGLVFGFSTMVTSQSLGHPHISLLALVPVVLALVEDLAWRVERPGLRRGALLAVVLVVQFYLSSEVLLLTALAVAVELVVLVVLRPSVARARVRPFLVPVGFAALLSAVLLVPAFLAIADARFRIGGPVQAFGYVGPARLLVQAPPALLLSAGNVTAHLQLNASEDGMFIGWPLLVGLVVVVVTLRRRLGVQVATVVGVVALLCQLQRVSPLLFLERHITVLQNIVTGRSALAMWAAIAYLVALGADAGWQRLRRARVAARPAALVIALVALGCLVPLIPNRVDAAAYRVGPVPSTPPFFTGAAIRRTIPDGATVLLAPFASGGDTTAELWQERSALRFRLVGGYALRPVGPSQHTFEAPQTSLQDALGLLAPGGRLITASVSPALLASCRAQLATSGAAYVIVGDGDGPTAELERRVAAIVGRGPDVTTGGAEVWRLR